MKINRAILPVNKAVSFSEDIDFSSLTFDPNHVKNISSCHTEIIATEFGNILEIKVAGFAHVIASCSYTLEDVPLNVKFNETFYFSDEITDSEDCYFESDNEIDLDQYILALILAEVPHNIVKKGAKLPKSGEGYRVLSEDEFEKERKNKKNNPFSALDELEFDEEN